MFTLRLTFVWRDIGLLLANSFSPWAGDSSSRSLVCPAQRLLTVADGMQMALERQQEIANMFKVYSSLFLTRCELLLLDNLVFVPLSAVVVMPLGGKGKWNLRLHHAHMSRQLYEAFATLRASWMQSEKYIAAHCL
jgi:hypothetical protein